MPKVLENKVALITGAGAGIGRASALVFAREGARVVVSDVDAGGAEETVAQVRRAGGDALHVVADVSDIGAVHRLIEVTVAQYGRLDCAFNNAGVEGERATTDACSRQNWDRVIAVNLTGTWLCMQAELQQMLRQGHGGAIVNMASVAGLVGFTGIPAYVASKHGIIGITKTAALEFAERGIRVNAVCPGVIDTEMIERFSGHDAAAREQLTALEPVGRMGRPEEVGETAAWLCSDAASFVTGHAMAVDGGFVAR